MGPSVLWAGLALLVWTAAPAAAENTDAVLHRIFLSDGDTLVSYGEYVRVGDRVIFSIPLGADPGATRTQLVSIPASVVDWPRTERYIESARHAHYTATRAESDYDALSTEIAQALNQIAAVPDTESKLQIAEQARRALVDWTRVNYGYRAKDIQQIVALFDAVISGIRASVGARRFDLSFVAMADHPQEPLLPRPTLQEVIAQALTAARLTTVPAERLSLLQSAAGILDQRAALLTASWVATARARAASDLAAELVIERAYTDLSRSTFEKAAAFAARADVRGVEEVVRTVLTRDEELGHRRPDQIGGLLLTIDGKLGAARRLRLERDRWLLRAKAYRDYQHALEKPIAQFNRSTTLLDDIRALAGPDDGGLSSLEQHIQRARQAFGNVTPPPVELQSVRSVLAGALQLADHAVRIRSETVASGSLRAAWNAASAAAGSLLFFTYAWADLERFLKPPELR